MYNANGKIKVSNTLESRLDLLAQQVTTGAFETEGLFIYLFIYLEFSELFREVPLKKNLLEICTNGLVGGKM